MNKHCARFGVLLVVSLLPILQAVSLEAQDAKLQPIYTDYFPAENLSWSSDGNALSFQVVEPGSRASERSWYAYDLSANALSESSTWPLQPTMTSSVRQEFALPENPNGNDRLAFPSPNEQFFVTATEEEVASGDQVPIVVDLQTNQSISTGLQVNYISSSTDEFAIHWSGNSEAFVLSIAAILSSEPEFFHHVTGYSTEPSQIEVQEITSFMVDDRLYGTLQIYDVSFDGDRVLLHGIYDTPSPTNRQTFFPLIVWNTEGQHQVLLEQFDKRRGDLLAASFAPDDENYILAVDDRGLVRYSLLDGSLEVLRADTNSERFHDALFSPDGQWLALVEAMPGRENVYIVPVG